MKISKKYLNSSIITSVILLILGILLIFKAEITISLISYIIGTILISIGMIGLLRFIKNINKSKNEYDFNIIYGIVTIILGILVIKNKETIASIIPFILGISIIINGSNKLQYALELKKANKNYWKTLLIASVISIACGILLIFNPFKGALLLIKIVGIFVSIYSVVDIISTIILKINIEKKFNDVKEAIIEEIK